MRSKASDVVASFLCVRPTNYTFHSVEVDADRHVTSIRDVRDSDIWINGGYFVLRREIFEYMNPGDELVHEPFERLIDERRLLAYRYEGFWAPMDTLKDKQDLETLAESGAPPWALWEQTPDDVGTNGGRHRVGPARRAAHPVAVGATSARQREPEGH